MIGKDNIPHPNLEDQKVEGEPRRPSDFVDKVPWYRKPLKKLKQTLAGETLAGQIGSAVKDGLTYFGVLPTFINKASDAIGAKFQTKDLGRMNWIINRLKERSTWRGIVGLATAVGLGLEPDQVTAIVTLGVAAAAVVEVFFKEAQSEDAAK